MSVLSKSCTCGHDHRTHRGEDVYMCLECSCTEYVARCQNCGEAVPLGHPECRIAGKARDVCSRRCAMQLEYAIGREATHA